METPKLRIVTLGMAVLAVAACATAPTPRGTSAPVQPSPVASPIATGSGSPAASPAASATTIAVFGPNDVAATIVDSVRVRSLPEISDASGMYEPTLPIDTRLVILNGPVQSDGYAWYDVAPVSRTELTESHGWVASGSPLGEPWLAASAADCPPPPTDLAALRSLTPGQRIACFSGRPLQVKARIVSCDCDVDGPATEPAWFGPGAQPNLLVEPDQTKPPTDAADWSFLALDPEAEQPDGVPIGKVVDVTGMFDHPAALDCQVAGFDGSLRPSSDCRFTFGVTRLALAG